MAFVSQQQKQLPATVSQATSSQNGPSRPMPRESSTLSLDGMVLNGVMPTELTPTAGIEDDEHAMKILRSGSTTILKTQLPSESASRSEGKVLRVDNMNQAVVHMQYDVRGMVPSVAETIQQ